MLVRRRGRPLGYLLRETGGGAVLPPDRLAEWIGRELGGKILADALTAELRSPVRHGALPTLTAAICTHARPDSLEHCLRALHPLQEEAGFKILVVDNAPSDEATATLVRRWPGVGYTREPRPGLDFARNRAWQEADTDWIAYLDDDALADREWIRGLAAAWRENPDAAAVTGLVLPSQLATEAQILFEKRGGFRRGFDSRRYRRTLGDNPLHPAGAGLFGTGANMAFRRDILAQLGGFDEALDTGRPLPGGGDLDLFFRVLEAGHILVYEPRCLVFHEHRKTLPALRRQYYTWGLGMMAYVGKHRTGPRRELFVRLTRWWFRDLLRQLRDSLRKRHVLPPSLLLAELAGGGIGLCGEYQRSRRRIEKIRAAHP